jgi:hypothetical protein
MLLLIVWRTGLCNLYILQGQILHYSRLPILRAIAEHAGPVFAPSPIGTLCYCLLCGELDSAVGTFCKARFYIIPDCAGSDSALSPNMQGQSLRYRPLGWSRPFAIAHWAGSVSVI